MHRIALLTTALVAIGGAPALALNCPTVTADCPPINAGGGKIDKVQITNPVIPGYGSPMLPFMGDVTLSGGSTYSHFPVASFDPLTQMMHVTYYYGTNHGQADVKGVSAPQTPSGASDLTIDGSYASGGQVSLAAPTFPTATAMTGDNTGKVVTVTCTNGGAPFDVAMTLGNGTLSRRTTTGAQRCKVITRVRIDSASVGQIEVGLNYLPGDYLHRASSDGGKSWSNPIKICDGLTTGLYFCYYGMNAFAEGVLYSSYVRCVIATSACANYFRRSRDKGETWDAETPLSYSGVTPPSTLSFYGPVTILPSGKWLAIAYSGIENYVFTSVDKGTTWVGKLMISAGQAPALSAISAPQTPSGAGPLAMDGTLVVGGEVIVSPPGRINTTSLTTNESARTLQIPALDIEGTPIIVSLAGSAGPTRTSTTYVSKVTGPPVIDGATSGQIEVGILFPQFSESAIGAVDENRWVVVSRVDGSQSAMKQFATTDGGDTWTDLGGLNIPITGGNVSPVIQTVYSQGVKYFALIWMSRNSSSLEPPAVWRDAVVSVVGEASKLLTSATAWSVPEQIIKDNITQRSGYPAVAGTPDGQLFVVMGHETVSEKSAELIGIGYDAAAHIAEWRRASACTDSRYGTGADGDLVNFTSVNLSRDMHYRYGRLKAGEVVRLGSFRVYFCTELDIRYADAGAFERVTANGQNASGATQGSASGSPTMLSLPTASAGTAGTVGVTGASAQPTQPTAAAAGQGGPGGKGGQGGANGAAQAAAAGGLAPAAPTTQPSLVTPDKYFIYNGTTWTPIFGGGGGAGGSAGRGDGTNLSGAGGGGAAGRAPMAVSARTLTTSATTPAGVFNVKGLNGGNGGNAAGTGSSGGGAGGGGSGAGWFVGLFGKRNGPSVANAVDISGGNGGTGGNGNTTGLGGAGGDGGSTGHCAVIYQDPPSITETAAGFTAGSAGSVPVTSTGGNGGTGASLGCGL